ncbi:MAG: Sensory box histidine kinase/response regulator [uncultured Sulfurovum sp.]|uniref:Sensory box histidine kinase/response regulator n=1 Tax=uncultured Sulfurovum sp. TaxID=269237 RepID=A0A6S6TU83_9BACT|nr:MAG: Sensory box histidine kinase/response regulator [uncultured Sulfurovum sp.]
MLKKIQILLTEDKEINQEIFIGLLEGTGISVDIAVNGQEAIEKSREKEYSLIVMDIEMPIMNGYEATKIIRTENSNIPIIALTANNSTHDRLKTKQLGMNAHLSKPIEPKILYQTFSKYIA